VETLLVTGIHREELAFGDRVAALMDKERTQVLRIPEGISHSRTGTDDLFYYNTRHREIYLQLRQQVKGYYRLLIDLHTGLNDSGRCADIYCRDESILQCVAEGSRQAGIGDQLRTVKILADSESSDPPEDHQVIEVGARTSIPKQIWNNRAFIYVGLEVYLPEGGVGTEEDWRFACDLIESVRACAMKDV
jgi:hypothetical protein